MSHDFLLTVDRKTASAGTALENATMRPRRHTWDDSQWDYWRRHVEESLLHDEDVVPRTIGVAALARSPSQVSEPAPSKLTTGASFASTVSNLVNTCIGGGMLSLPWVLARCGVGGGLLMMVLVPLLAEFTLDFLVASAELTGAHTLTAITEHILGRTAGLLCASTLLLLSFGVLVSYCVVIKQLTPRLVRFALTLSSLPSDALCLAVVCATCLVPLSSMSTMAQLRFASAASVVMVAGFVLSVVWAAFRVELGLSPMAAQACHLT
jgi:hypothetical protein